MVRSEGVSEGEVRGRKVGLVEGKGRGLVKGREAERQNIARSLLEKGMSEAEVAEVTGLTPEEVAAL